MSYQSTTPYFELPQYLPSDAFQMRDFNTAFANIDSKAQAKISVMGMLKSIGAGHILPAIPGADYMAANAIESGSNDNGNWLKLPDGTLIMWRFGAVTLGDTSTAYLPLPVSVAEDGAVAVASATSYYNSMTSVGCHVTSDRAQIAIYFSSGGTAITGKTMRYNYIVIGRWKDYDTESGEEPYDPTADIYAQIVYELEKMSQKLDSVLDTTDSRYANAITGQATGTLVTLTDAWVGGMLPKCETQGRSSQIVTQQGKNLFDITQMTYITGSGSTYEVLENSTIRVAVSLAGTYRNVVFTTLAFDALKGLEVTVGTDIAVSGSNRGQMAVQFLTDGASTVSQYITASTGFKTFTVPEAFDEVRLVFYSNCESTEEQVGDTATYANIQIETGNTRTDYEPFVPNSPSPDYPAQISGITPAKVWASSKNLLNPALLSDNKVVTSVLQDDGTLLLNGSDDSTNATLQHPGHPIYLPAGEYRLSLNTVSGTYSSPSDVIYFGMRKSDGTTALSNQITNSVTSKSFRFVSTGLYYYFYMVGVFTCTDWRISVQLEPGTVTTAYEPYTGAEYPLPELPPLYSLSDGVCDTYDAAAGTETRRIGVIDSYSSQTVGDNWISSTGALTEGAQVIYELAEPIITQHDPIAITIPAPTTNISADAGEVNITYTKDTNRVITALTERIAALEGGNNA